MSLTILSIDTATEICSVGILYQDKTHQKMLHKPQEHAQIVLPMVNELLAELHLKLAQCDAIAFTAGPGSFTGLRIGAGVVQGLAYGTDLPVIQISTLAAMAQGAYRAFQATMIFPMLNARMNEVYLGTYQVDSSGRVYAMNDDTLLPLSEVTIHCEKQWLGVGSGWLIENRFETFKENIKGNFYCEPQDVLKLAVSSFEKGELIKAQEVSPKYLRNKVVR